jgi:hypothetical protein
MPDWIMTFVVEALSPKSKAAANASITPRVGIFWVMLYFSVLLGIPTNLEANGPLRSLV